MNETIKVREIVVEVGTLHSGTWTHLDGTSMMARDGMAIQTRGPNGKSGVSTHTLIAVEAKMKHLIRQTRSGCKTRDTWNSARFRNVTDQDASTMPQRLPPTPNGVISLFGMVEKQRGVNLEQLRH